MCFTSPLKSFTKGVHSEFCINCPIVLAAFQIQVASNHISGGRFRNIILIFLQTEILHDFQQFVLFCAVVGKGKAPDYIAPIFKVHCSSVIDLAAFCHLTGGDNELMTVDNCFLTVNNVGFGVIKIFCGDYGKGKALSVFRVNVLKLTHV